MEKSFDTKNIERKGTTEEHLSRGRIANMLIVLPFVTIGATCGIQYI